MFDTQPEKHCSYDYVTQVQQRYTDYLLHKPRVVGVSVGTLDFNGDNRPDAIYYCLVVLVSAQVPPEQLPPEDRIPDELDGVPVKVQEVGEINAQATNFSAGG